MSSFWHRRIPFRYVVLFVFLGIGCMDWGSFFPLSSHHDLRFQIVGEAIELFAFCLLMLLIYAANKKYVNETRISPVRAAWVGLYFAGLLLLMHWRRCFPGDHFEIAKVANLGFEAVGQAAIFGCFIYAFQRKSGRPSKVDEKSVV